MNKGPARRIRLRAVVAYPAVSVALVVSAALALAPFSPSQAIALAGASIPLETTAPIPTTTSTPSATSTATPTPTTAPSPTPIPSPSPAVAALAGAAQDHFVLARIEGPQFQAQYLDPDVPVLDASQFQTFRVRFALPNAGTDPITVTPQLEYRPEGATSAYVVVPDKPLPGVAFHVAREWVPSLGLGGGTMQSELGEDIAVADLLVGGSGSALIGHRSMGANPDQTITLPSDSYTAQEFTVTLSIDAQYDSGYELRITDGGTALTGTAVATIRLGAPPAVVLSPDQRQGVAVVDPAPTSTSAGAAYPLLSTQPLAKNATSVSAVNRPNTVTYPLTASALSAATVAPDEIHGPYSMTTDKCAVCHRAHTAKAPNLLAKSNSQSALCFECHGNGNPSSNTDVQTGYTDTALPENVPSAREYYSHDAVDPTPPMKHTRSGLDEFGAKSNRHSECADCHNSHKAGTTDTTQSAAGWTASGRLAGVSGVSVLNGAAGSAPTYTFLSGVSDVVNDEDPVTDINPITLEYQLCFKCHSGFTTLTSNDGLPPSQYALDKGVEFNPLNASFHPVEAKGKNETPAMTNSLTKTSPYKLWNFTINSTIRCLNCHATSASAGGAPPLPPVGDPSLPLPGSALAPHTSVNRGILLRNYQDRVLKSTGAAYSAGDFALCYVCHAEEPFAPGGTASAATNFSLHSLHLTELALKGDGVLDIDKAGAGQGNAICAECHFRIHSTTSKVGEPGGSRLVNFAPNVVQFVPDSGPAEPITWTPGVTSGGSCTLTCHLHKHKNAPY